MAQRVSGYARIDHDLYETPEWVTEALLPHLPAKMNVWEPASASGKIAAVLMRAGHPVMLSDVRHGGNFLQLPNPGSCDAIITNPPFNLAFDFINHSLALMKPMRGIVAMLLRIDYDSAKTRVTLFNRPPFAKKIVLTRRIRWIVGSTGSPSENHSWYIWDWRHAGPPTIAYEPD